MLILVLYLVLSVPAATAQSAPPETGTLDVAPDLPLDDPAFRTVGPLEPDDALPLRHREFLRDADLLLTDEERAAFLSLDEDYRRDAFVRRFWRSRDPEPRTARNELREEWTQRAARARELYDHPADERARYLLLIGEPARRETLSCPELRYHLEVWEYPEGASRVSGSFSLVFYGLQSRGRGPHRLWSPVEGLRALVGLGGPTIGASEGDLARYVAGRCTRGDDVLQSLTQTLDVSRVDPVRLYPQRGGEWVGTFLARSTTLPEDAETLDATLQIAFPGRHQSRTVVQGLITVDPASVEPLEIEEARPVLAIRLPDSGSRSSDEPTKRRVYNFLVDGEILRQGELFDQFRYRFDLPARAVSDAGSQPGSEAGSEAGSSDAASAGRLPLVVQRYLRPGEYTWVVRVRDLGTERYFRTEQTIDVPRTPATRTVLAVGDDGTVEERQMDAASFDPLAEANAALAQGDQSIRILPFGDDLQVGALRVGAEARGEGIAKVAFYLNDRQVMRKSRPPYSVELDLGSVPRVHTLRVEALGEDGARLADDEVLVNAGPHRFDLRLIEPRRGVRYEESLRVHAEPTVPEGERLDRVEIYLDELLVATLYQPPFEQPLLLPPASSDATRYVRAVAYLADGTATEDVRLINAPDEIDEIRVNFVELYTSVVDNKGAFVDDLEKDDFRVLEDGEPQRVERFETMRDVPIRAGLLVDTSVSMDESLRDVERAGLDFFATVLDRRDRAAVVTFADEPELRVRFTNDQEVLEAGLGGLVAEGETALWDALIYTTHYFSGLDGKRAILLITDGEDSASRYDFTDAIDFAQRAGVAVYPIGLGLPNNAHGIRALLNRLARDTGGDAYYVENSKRLPKIYDRIQAELRSQYLLAYQAPPADDDEDGEAFRRVEVEVERRGVEARTIPGYFP